MSDHDFFNATIRRQIIEATYNAGHSQPPVNLVGALDGCRVEVYGEELGTYGFILANIQYRQARKAADWAVAALSNTLARKEA